MNIKIQKIKLSKFYAVIIDNFYEQYQYDLILNECISFCKEGLLKDANETGGANDDNGVALKNNKGLFLDEYYHVAKIPREFSSILTFNRKIFDIELIKLLVSIDPIYTYVSNCNVDTSLLSYYENNNYYKTHHDGGMITSLFWLYQTPKSFTGGDLVFPNSKRKIKCVSNRIIFFPSFLDHMVMPVKMKKNNLCKQLGRFCISNFTTYTQYSK